MAGNLGLPYVNPNDDEYATKTQANLARAQWDDYVHRFEPYERKLLDMIGNESNLTQALSGADEIAQSSFDSASRGMGMSLAKYGTAQDEKEQQATSRQMNLNRAATQAGLRNKVRTEAYDRDVELMTGAGNTISGMKTGDS